MKEIAGLSGFEEKLKITFINDEQSPENLNAGCGAEHVNKEQAAPANITKGHANLKCACFDGDADRQMYFYTDEEGKFHMMNGDKQFALIMFYIIDLMTKLGIQDKLSHILVQTAYCNSTSTKYFKENNVKTQLAKTGVKYSHAIVKNYDIGANTEPNGHGTVAYK